jgi:hypothetical protein
MKGSSMSCRRSAPSRAAALAALLCLYALPGIALPQVRAGFLVVPGTADPYLADPRNQTDPAADGTIPPSISVTGLTSIQFSATGQTSFEPGALGPNPDGSFFTTAAFGRQGGISSWDLPVDSLVGIFTPAPLTAPPATPSVTDFSTLSPQLGQVFFIGDGLTGTGTGTRQTFFVPAGATTLSFANIDGFGWFNDGGAFDVTVLSPALNGAPEPASLSLFGLGIVGMGGYAWRRRRAKV